MGKREKHVLMMLIIRTCFLPLPRFAKGWDGCAGGRKNKFEAEKGQKDDRIGEWSRRKSVKGNRTRRGFIGNGLERGYGKRA
jgi:hypothetical protein